MPERSPIAEFVADVEIPTVIGIIAFAILFWMPIENTALAWWNEPDAGHGLLLFPISAYLVWKSGVSPKARPQVALGLSILVAAVVLRYLSGLASEWYTMRWSVLLALSGLVVMKWGLGQIKFWWLPAALLVLSVPLPSVVLNSIALPLQLKASQLGASLLEWRHVPVYLEGNVIQLPGRSLFVTEACSGLRSLTALISLGVLVSGMWISTLPGRVTVVLAAIPVAMFLNGVRVFLTGFLVHFVNPELGEGFMHLTEGWLIFVLAFAVLGLVGKLVIVAERWYMERKEVVPA